MGLGCQINDNLNLTVGCKSTNGDSAPGDLRIDSFMVTQVYGWPPLLEGARRLKRVEQAVVGRSGRLPSSNPTVLAIPSV